MITKAYLDELKQLVARAHKPPWYEAEKLPEFPYAVVLKSADSPTRLLMMDTNSRSKAFIKEAPWAIPALIEYLEKCLNAMEFTARTGHVESIAALLPHDWPQEREDMFE